MKLPSTETIVAGFSLLVLGGLALYVLWIVGKGIYNYLGW